MVSLSHSIKSKLKDWLYEQVTAFIQIGAKLVPDAQKRGRLNECSGCDARVKKQIKPYLPEVDACADCGGCILDVKAKMLTHFRQISKKDQPLTEEELIFYNANKLIRPELFEEVIITCPRKKWAQVDKKFKT